MSLAKQCGGSRFAALGPATLGVIGLAAASVAACGPGGQREPSGEGAICPSCGPVPVGGGETSDFGGADPCRAGAKSVRVSEAEARAAGFGDQLDLLVRDFEAPLAWSALELNTGEPALGYQPLSRMRGATRIIQIDHLVPTGCDEEWLDVVVQATLESEDGALAVAGPLWARTFRDFGTPSAYGRIDLSTATGSLRLLPPPTQRLLLAEADVELSFWPEQVRGTVLPVVRSQQGPPDDVLYRPVQGSWPIDSCPPHAWPFESDTPLPMFEGYSARILADETQSVVDAAATVAVWQDGTQTAVQAKLGAPSRVCYSDNGRLGSLLEYGAPISVESSDGRLRLQSEVDGWGQFDSKGALTTTGIAQQLYGEMSPQEFTELTGIDDVDFGDAPVVVGSVLVEGGTYFNPRFQGLIGFSPVSATEGVLDPVTVTKWGLP